MRHHGLMIHLALGPILFLFEAVVKVGIVLSHDLPLIPTALIDLVQRELLQLLIVDKGSLRLHNGRVAEFGHDLIIVIRLVVVVEILGGGEDTLGGPSSLLGLGFLRFFLCCLSMLGQGIINDELGMRLEVEEGGIRGILI